MPTTMTIDQLQELKGAPVFAHDGEEIGSVEEVYVDDRTDRPEWIGLGTGFFGTKRVLVPVEAADVRNDGIFVPYSKDQVKDAPDIDADHIDEETEGRLYAHYRLGSSASDSGDLAETMKNEAAMTRSEEELRVGKREEEMGRLRLHKWVETDEVNVPVDVRREKARVTREPVDETVSDRDIGDDALEVTLREERPVVEKETVAKEKIGVEKDVETDTETVSGEVRKERVDVDESTR